MYVERLESLLTGAAAEAVANFSSLAEETYSATQYSNAAAISLPVDTDTVIGHTDVVLEGEAQNEGEEERKDDDLNLNGAVHEESSSLPPAPPATATEVQSAASSRLSLPPWPVFASNEIR